MDIFCSGICDLLSKNMSSRDRTASTARIESAMYRKSVLPNGIRVVTEQIPYVRSASIGVWANVGSRDESPSQNGISHFLEHMVFKGTKNRSVREIARSIESLGGYLNAFTTKEQTCFYARVLDEHVPHALDVLSDLVQNATFRKEELDKERYVVIEELKNAEDDPEDLIHDHFEKSLFPKHPLGFPIIGTVENLKCFNREHLTAHCATHYNPANMVLAAAGNVDHDTICGLVEPRFCHLSKAQEPTRRRSGPKKNSSPGYKEISKPISQAHVCLGTVAYGIHHKERYSLLVLNALLGEGMSSRLYQTIREKHGLAYSIYSFVSMLSDTGIFGTYVGTDKKNIARTIDLIHQELTKLQSKPVSRAELLRTKSQIKGTLMLGLENMSGRMMRLGSGELYFQSYIPLDTVLQRVNAVTPDSIQKTAREILDWDGFSTVVIRPS
jgi:predicted Zn-dependent peptidase